MSTRYIATKNMANTIACLTNLWKKNEKFRECTFIPEDKEFSHMSAVVEETNDGWKRTTNIGLHWNHDETSKYQEKILISYCVTYWPGCCALTIFSNLFVDDNLRMNPMYEKIMEALKKDLIHLERDYYSSSHKMIFAFSDEEIPYQFDAALMLGFSPSSEPFISTKTSNNINTMELIISSDDSIEEAEWKYNSRNSVRKPSTVDTFYDLTAASS